MSEPKIRRKLKSVPVTLSTSVDSSTALRWDDVAGGAIVVGTMSTSATSFQVWASNSASGTFGRLRKSDGVAVDVTLSPSTATSSVYAMPDESYGCGAIKIVSGDTNSTSATCIVTMKS